MAPVSDRGGSVQLDAAQKNGGKRWNEVGSLGGL